MSIESVMPSNRLILCRPLPLLPSIFPSIRGFSSESVLCIRWPKDWSFNFRSVLPMNIQHWFPLGLTDSMSLLPRGLSSLLQHHSSKAQILQHSAFFMVQLSHPYMTTGNIIALTRQTFVSKVMSLPFNMLSRLIIAFLPGRRQWHPTPELLPGKSNGRSSLVGCSLWGCWVGHDWATSLSLFTFMQWRRKWQPTPVFLPGESQGRESLVDCCLWDRTESDTIEAT